MTVTFDHIRISSLVHLYDLVVYFLNHGMVMVIMTNSRSSLFFPYLYNRINPVLQKSSDLYLIHSDPPKSRMYEYAGQSGKCGRSAEDLRGAGQNLRGARGAMTKTVPLGMDYLKYFSSSLCPGGARLHNPGVQISSSSPQKMIWVHSVWDIQVYCKHYNIND